MPWYLFPMEMYETALGRLVPPNEGQTVLEDSVLHLLYSYRLNPQNPDNAPMKLSDIVHAVLSDAAFVAAALDALQESTPPLVEERAQTQGERTFSITGTGVRFVRNMLQGLASVQ